MIMTKISAKISRNHNGDELLVLSSGETFLLSSLPGYSEVREADKNLAIYFRSILRKVREDINWMLNNQKFLNPNSFDYLDAAVDAQISEKKSES